MARVFINDQADTKHFYTVDQSVGVGGANSREDVLLVQFFLRVGMENSPQSAGFIPPGEKPISIDGSCGRQTNTYIKFFQVEEGRRTPGFATTTEGRIDPVTTGTFRGSITGRLLTIIALNIVYRTRRGILIADIKKDPLFPAELTKSFYIN
ncbi:MAG: hypothetical protein ABI686_00865 [Acidobacteriota bacterium]